MFDEVKFGAGFFLIIFVVVLAIGAISLGAKAIFLPANIAIEREAVQQSQQYNETKTRLLNDLYEDVLQLDVEILEATNPSVASAKRAQRAQMVRQMREESQLMARSQIPEVISTFLKAERQR